MKLAAFAKHLGISQNALRAAMADGRITAFVKGKRGYEFDPVIAEEEYEQNTNHALSSNSRLSEDPGDLAEKSVLDIEPKNWTGNQALQAKTIYSALKVKHELEVMQGKFYEKKAVDDEIVRIGTTFSRGLMSLPTRVKQKIPEITVEGLELLKQICSEISDECDSKLEDLDKS
ncbi:MAG: hypothetical protein ACXVB1_00225 [Pseudobdellovibrionaceae bacterium]